MGTLLKKAYTSSLLIALEEGIENVATSLIGSGARGIPHEEAVTLAIEALSEFKSNDYVNVCFGIIDDFVMDHFDTIFASKKADWTEITRTEKDCSK